MNSNGTLIGELVYGSSNIKETTRSQPRQAAVDLAVAAGPRYDTIDLLRGLSILGVILLHASLYLSFSGQTVGTTLPKWVQYMIFNEGGKRGLRLLRDLGVPDHVCVDQAFRKPLRSFSEFLLPNPLCTDCPSTVPATDTLKCSAPLRATELPHLAPGWLITPRLICCSDFSDELV